VVEDYVRANGTDAATKRRCLQIIASNAGIEDLRRPGRAGREP
jgi:hypothetical protein